MKKQYQFLGILLCLLISIVACSNNEPLDKNSTTERVELTISAAASLKEALKTIEQNYKEDHPEVTLQFNFGGSGSLQQQILQGAPVDLFFSAADDKFDLLVREGNIAAEDGLDLLGNSLVLVVRKGEQTITSIEDLANEVVEQLSIGTPETVPAGKYAKEAFENMNIWEDVESKIVYAKDVRQVLSYVETGNVQAGIVYKTDALVSDKVDIIATVDPATHPPIIYPVGIMKDSANYEAANDFYEYLQRKAALKVFEDYGFTINE